MILTNVLALTTRYDAPLFIYPNRDIALLKNMGSNNNKYLTIRDMLDYEVNLRRQEKISSLLYMMNITIEESFQFTILHKILW